MPRRKKEEPIEKQHNNRDHTGRYATPDRAVPNKSLRSFLSDLMDKHGDVRLSHILTHYDNMIKETTVPGTKYAMQDTSNATVPDVLDELFKADMDNDFDVYTMLRFDDFNAMNELHRIQEHVKGKLPYPWISWEDLSELHLTLTYCKGASPQDAAIIAEHVEEVKPVDNVTVNSGTVFEPSNGSDGRYVIVLNVEKTPELEAMQRRLYELSSALILDHSEYSDPENWRPHITLGYSEEPVDANVVSDVGGFTVKVSKIDVSVDRQVIGSAYAENYKETTDVGNYSVDANKYVMEAASEQS